MQAVHHSKNAVYVIEAKAVEGNRGEICVLRATSFGGSHTALRGLLRWMVVRASNAELLHSMAERVGMQIQDFRRTFRSLDHPEGQLEGSQDMISLYLSQSRKP